MARCRAKLWAPQSQPQPQLIIPDCIGLPPCWTSRALPPSRCLPPVAAPTPPMRTWTTMCPSHGASTSKRLVVQARILAVEAISSLWQLHLPLATVTHLWESICGSWNFRNSHSLSPCGSDTVWCASLRHRWDRAPCLSVPFEKLTKTWAHHRDTESKSVIPNRYFWL